MRQESSELWHRVRQARAKLAAQLLNHPGITLIDIGYVYEGDQRTDEIALRIHIRERGTNAEIDDGIAFPNQLDGIPVIVLYGDYRPKTRPFSANCE